MGERELFLTTLVINGLFDLPDIENDDFLTLCEDVNAKRIQDVLKVVTVLGTKWSLLRQESNLRILLHLGRMLMT
ncbi:hypothetical protein ERO13_D04G065833v2 [Gossypium hirsutum]|uniref:Uncharacterized protein n=2 Tax=Gossypium TaxID=3633 RepID=A0A5D2LAY4_GOSTO|nr:hypothetical protein ERO13_D04G065833v2 [Gossypium hirsutum]TYG73159.1 hypothetical protein ES288_D04G078400v1 [Gossypium darwinii]TYH76339.1 hypothetical protein ES332_D04G078400v1 [Gossypium tomentosum]